MKDIEALRCVLITQFEKPRWGSGAPYPLKMYSKACTPRGDGAAGFDVRHAKRLHDREEPVATRLPRSVVELQRST